MILGIDEVRISGVDNHRKYKKRNIKIRPFRGAGVISMFDYPSIIKITKTIKSAKCFSFNEIDQDYIIKEIDDLDKSKACQESDIPIEIIKENKNIFLQFLYIYINLNIRKSVFPSELKKADVRPIFKKDSRTEKSNYRPISILPNISKIFERCLFDQLITFFDGVLSPLQCRFRKGYNAQYCLITLV